MLKEKIQLLAKKLHTETIINRRHIHAHPELSFQEYNTSEYVASYLTQIGFSVQKVANTGLVALLKGDKKGNKVVALRADMDALPITELNNVDYKSTNAGVMHACGHDVHTASLLATAAILVQLKSEFGGTIKFIFQPGEEKLPGGASLMIKEGVLKNPNVDGVIGQHVMPFLEAGKVGFRSGKYMASTDEIYLTVKGKGGHGAMPQFNIDPVTIAAHIIIALQQIVSRYADPRIPSVLSFGKVIADGATNVIPNEVRIEGTFRTLDEDWRSQAHGHIIKIAKGIAESMGATCEVELMKGYPYLINEENLTASARSSAEEYLGKENVVDLDVWMAAEDFAYYSQETNACFYRLGTRNESKGIVSSVHTPTFDIDESALEIGPGLMAYIVLKELNAEL